MLMYISILPLLSICRSDDDNMAMSSSRGVYDWVALAAVILLLGAFFRSESNQMSLRAEVLKKEANSDSTDASIERQQIPNATTTVEGGTIDLRPCEFECKVTKQTLGPPLSQHANLDYDSGSADIIFLLGYAFTGTSAMHFLLSTSGNVSTLTGFGALAAREEGWSLEGMKHNGKDRWDGALEWVNWTQLAQAYGKRWARTDEGGKRPLKVENSPPEIQAPKALKEAFEPMYGKVKFIMLVRGDCTYSGDDLFAYRFLGYQKVLREFPRDTFVLRYEDLCLAWDEVHKELARWEPLLADINISSIPASFSQPLKGIGGNRRLGHAHDAVSIREYCESKLPQWNNSLKPRESKNTNRTVLNMLAEYGYSKTNTC